jgi:hypothetical protein
MHNPIEQSVPPSSFFNSSHYTRHVLDKYDLDLSFNQVQTLARYLAPLFPQLGLPFRQLTDDLLLEWGKQLIDRGWHAYAGAGRPKMSEGFQPLPEIIAFLFPQWEQKWQDKLRHGLINNILYRPKVKEELVEYYEAKQA